MEKEERQSTLTGKQHTLVDQLSKLPHKILQHHHLSKLSHMILHELGHDNCFGFNKAIYLVDNPDFDHLIGVAGFHKEECCQHKNNIWESPKNFEKLLQESKFHNKVKKVIRQSLRRKKDIDLSSTDDLQKLGKCVGMESPDFFWWDMKHGNHGILIYETNKKLCEWQRGLLNNMAALLSLCGI